MSNNSSHEDIHAKLAKHGKASDKAKSHQTDEQEPEAEQPAASPKTPVGDESLLAQLTEAEKKNAQYWDRLMRLQADMENAARRAEKDVANAHKFALEKFVNELLPVIDNLERAISHAQESKADAEAILEGVDLTLKMLLKALEKHGVQQVNPLNEAFNPSFHEAVSTQADPAIKPGQVINVLQKGYLLNERLVRPALVIVSK